MCKDSARSILVACLMLSAGFGQTKVEISTQVSARGSVDFSAAAATKPAKTGASLPNACSPGELFFLVSTAGQNFYGCTAQSAWAPLAGSTPLVMAAQVGDLLVGKIGPLLVIGAGCTSATPCNTRFGHVVYRITNPATAQITAGNGSGMARVYASEAGVVVVDHSSSAGLTVSCTGCGGQQSSNPTVPPEAIHLADVSITNGLWDVVTDQRAFLASKTIRAGAGIVLADVSGETEVSIDPGDIPRLGQANAWTGENDFSAASRLRVRTGLTDPPAGECAGSGDTGQVFVRQNAAARNASFYVCANTAAGVFEWERISTGVSPGAYLRQNNGVLSFSAVERQNVFLRDEFYSTSGRVGQLAWDFSGVLAVDTATDADHPGVVQVTTAGSANSVARLRLGSASQPVTNNLTSRSGWEALFIFRLGTLTGNEYQYRIGLLGADSAAPNQGVYARLVNSSACAAGNAADAEWQIESRASASSTTVTPVGVPGSSGDWVAFRIRSVSSGELLGALARNGGAFGSEQTLTTTLPAGALFPVFQVQTCGSSERSLQADAFAFTAGGLAR